MPAEIIDETDAAPSGGAAPSLVEAAEAAMEVLLEALDRSDSEVVVLLVDDQRIRELNRQWRGKDSATDVLSFSQLEGETVGGEEAGLLGDIVVSLQTMERQAGDGGWTQEEELTRLLLHGLLHLLGYDHEDADDEAVMKKEEGRLAAVLLARGLGCAWEDEGDR